MPSPIADLDQFWGLHKKFLDLPIDLLKVWYHWNCSKRSILVISPRFHLSNPTRWEKDPWDGVTEILDCLGVKCYWRLWAEHVKQEAFSHILAGCGKATATLICPKLRFRTVSRVQGRNATFCPTHKLFMLVCTLQYEVVLIGKKPLW